MNSTITMAFGLVLVLSVIFSVASSGKSPTIHSFFWGDRRLEPRLVASLIVTSSFSLNGLLYQTWLGFKIGWWSLAIQAVWCLGFWFLAKRIHNFKDLLGTGTMHGIIASKFGSKAGTLAAIASVLGFSILIGWEVVVGATVLGNVANFDPSLAFWLPALFAIFGAGYTALGGVRGNARVNFVQNIVKSAVLLVGFGCLIYVAKNADAFSAASSKVNIWTAAETLGGWALGANLAFSLFWQIVDMSNWQNLSATKVDGKSDRRSIVIAAGIVFLFPGLIGTVIGIALSGLPVASGLTDTNILNGFVNALESIPFIGIALFAAFAAAMLSTMDGYALAASQAVSWDLVKKKTVSDLLPLGPDRLASAEDASVIYTSRVSMFVLAGLAAFCMGNLVVSGLVGLFDLVYLVVIAQMSLVGPVLASLFGNHNSVASRLGWTPIAFALVAGYASALLGKVGWSEAFYTFSPVVTIFISCLVSRLVIDTKK